MLGAGQLGANAMERSCLAGSPRNLFRPGLKLQPNRFRMDLRKTFFHQSREAVGEVPGMWGTPHPWRCRGEGGQTQEGDDRGEVVFSFFICRSLWGFRTEMRIPLDCKCGYSHTSQ